MKVHLRQRKQTKNGKISLYLEYYKGTVKTDEGKTKVLRDYEYLDLYLKDNPQTKQERQTNKETLELAKSIKAKRELQIKNGEYGFNRSANKNANFVEYFKKQVEKRSDSENTYYNWHSSYNHLIDYAGETVPFKQISKEFCEGFKDYLCDLKKKGGGSLSSGTIRAYFSKFSSALSQAVSDKIISENPAKEVKTPTVKTPKREFLTAEELKKVSKEECKYPVLKRAFLFSCLTGLRFSDIQKMEWSNVEESEDGWRVVFYQKKTDGLQYHDIPENAIQYLGERASDSQKVFDGLRYSGYFNVALKKWMLKAGITKDITFHCARHTYAILQLQYGADIYTVSKLLGHKSIESTQIYADILDKKKREAVNRLNDIEL